MFKITSQSIKKSIWIIGLVLILGIAITATYFSTIPYTKIPSFIENEMNSGLSFTRDGGIPIEGIKGYTLGRDYKIVQTKYDLQKPVYSMVVSYSSDEKKEGYPIIQARVIYLERQGFQDWKVTKYLDNQVNGLNFKEVQDLTSKYDITTDFPGKSNYNITNYPPLTPEEIENNRKLRERDERIKQEQERALQEYNQKTPQEKIKDLEELKQRQLDNKEEILKQLPEEMFYADIQIWDKEIEKIKKENGIN